LEGTQELTVQTVPDLDHPVRSLERPVHFLEQAVGSGKTGLVVSRIASASTESHIFVAPTIELGKEVKERLLSAGAQNVHQLFNEARSESVVKRAMRLINGRAPRERHVLIVTGKTFRAILADLSPVLAQHYHLYLDEGMNAVEYVQFQAENMEQYTRLLSTNRDGLLVPAHGGKELLENVATRDDLVRKQGKENLLTKNFVNIASLVTSGLYDVRARITDNSIRAVALLRPHRFQAFRSVTMVAAIWSQSILAMVWSQRYGVKVEALAHNCELYDTHKAKGPRMEIYYCLHPRDRASSENLQRDVVTGEKGAPILSQRQVISSIAQTVHGFFANRGLDYCWSANDRFKNNHETLKGERMPVVAAGLNKWQHIDNVAALASMNPPTWVKGILLEFLDIDPNDTDASDEVYRQWRFAHTYQTVGRCSLRDRNSDRPKVVVVLSLQCAEDLAAVFPGASIGGCITELPCFADKDALKRRREAVRYDASDNKAWSLWRKRHPQYVGDKRSWFENEPRYRKAPRSVALAA
jgi:hypothetical protein